MTIKKQLIREIEQTPDTLLTEILDFLLFVKQRHNQGEITDEKKANITDSESNYLAENNLTINEKDFFKLAGVWENREINIDSIRQQAWQEDIK